MQHGIYYDEIVVFALCSCPMFSEQSCYSLATSVLHFSSSEIFPPRNTAVCCGSFRMVNPSLLTSSPYLTDCCFFGPTDETHTRSSLLTPLGQLPWLLLLPPPPPTLVEVHCSKPCTHRVAWISWRGHVCVQVCHYRVVFWRWRESSGEREVSKRWAVHSLTCALIHSGCLFR